MLSLNLDMSALFTQVNTWFNALWPVAVITIGIPFGFSLVQWIGSALLKNLRVR